MSPWVLTWIALMALYVLVPQRPTHFSAAVPAAFLQRLDHAPHIDGALTAAPQ